MSLSPADSVRYDLVTSNIDPDSIPEDIWLTVTLFGDSL